MTYKLFIDDERFPPNDGEEWIIARSFYDVGNILYEKGMPEFISFDHDLGEKQKTGYDIAKYLCDLDMDFGVSPDHLSNKYSLPDNFDFYVHSQNPIGAENIRKYLNNYLKKKRKQ